MLKKKVIKELSNKFEILFDGWSLQSTHHVCVFVTFPTKINDRINLILLAFSPLEDESRLTAQEHERFMEFVLQNVHKTWDNVVCFVGDNCSINKSLAKRLEIPMICCHGHRFNLALQDLLKTYKEILDKVSKIMLQLKNQIPATKLRKFTPLSAKTRNVTRWSSTFTMLKLYREIRQFLSKLEIGEIEELALTKKKWRSRCSFLYTRKNWISY